MKSKVFLTLAGLFFSFAAVAQECNASLSLFNESAKTKNYDNAYKHYKKLIKDCPDANIITYQRGKKMLENFIENAETPEEKEKFVQMFIDNQNMRLEYFPKKTKKVDMLSDIAKVMYKNEVGTLEERLEAFESIVEEDADNFTDATALYAYFRIANTMNDEGLKDIQFLFDKYDEVITLIETQENSKAIQVQPLIEKEENQEKLTSREKKILKNSEIYLRNYTKIKGSVNSLLGSKADCENLIPMYEKDFESKKGDVQWLKNAASRLFAKECTEDEIFFKVVEAQNDLKPSAKTALYLGRLAQENGNMSKALEYYNQSAELEDKPADKARVYYNIAETYKKKGSLSSARTFYRKALKHKPSMGVAYLKIAEMYAGSANTCGNSTFEKRGVYWLAADYAMRAGRVDPSLKSTADATAESYNGRAPQKSDIFQESMAGKTITYSCWIGESVKVPNF
ncbi:MAG: tetratricopeptide repeat protein [Flavobacteriaceae bacterium]|nr:tetratricopeptide repeat protein [Psychroflexus sp.]